MDAHDQTRVESAARCPYCGQVLRVIRVQSEDQCMACGSTIDPQVDKGQIPAES